MRFGKHDVKSIVLEFGKNNIEDYIIECIEEREVGIAAFSECNQIDFSKISRALNDKYKYVEPI